MTQTRPRLDDDLAAEVQAYAECLSRGLGTRISFNATVTVLLRRALLECPGPMPRLTADDRDLIARARALSPEYRRRPGDLDRLIGELLRQLADRLERLGGPAPDEEENHG